MANTNTITKIFLGNKRVVYYVSIESDGTQETDLLIHDSSVIATALGVSDPLNCRIRSIKYWSNSSVGVVHLEWDATTDVLAWAMPFGGNTGEIDFGPAGIKNTAGTGKTGDILLTTTGLASGSRVSFILDVRPY